MDRCTRARLWCSFPDWGKADDPYTLKTMTTALHLAYRPQTLQDLVGQPTIQRTLSNAIAQQHIAPAYLFTGARGTGKTSTARIFAKALNCLNSDQPTIEPCGECQSCRSIEVSSSLDVTEIDAASHNGVDDARELTQRVNLAPVLGRYRVVIMDECLAGDSLILTDLGLMRIDNPAIAGKNVLSFNEKNENWEFKPITCQWIRGKRHTLAIKTTASEIRCTPEHLIRTSHGWKRAETIQPGDRILIAPHTFLLKSGSKFLNSYNPLVPVDVENDWTFPFSINAAQSITLLAPTGSNTQLRRTTGLNNRLPIKSLYLNPYAPSACVDVAGGLIFQSIFSIAEPLPPEFSTIGQTIPTTIRMALNKPQFASAMMPSSPFHSKLWGESTEPYWVMDQSATHMLLPFPPECPGHMALTRRTGYDINVSSSQSLSLRSVLYPIRATGTPRFAPEPFVIPISKKSTTWCDQMSIASESIQTGSTASVKKVWHGGIWTMDHSTAYPLDHSRLHYTQKDIQNQRTSCCSNGLNPLDIQLLSGRPGNEAKFTMGSDSQQPAVENGLNSSVHMLFQQWHTNSTCVESVAWFGVTEPVYDLEVADNHNFVANGLLVHNCHQLTIQAQNALLKCIEEPPQHVVFLLCTTEPHKVLPTIASRCQRFEFRALSVKTIVEYLRWIAEVEAIAIQEEALVAIARLCEGGLRDALQLLAQVRLLGEEVTASQVIELAGGIAEADLMTVLQAIAAHDTFQLLQTARNLMDAGKAPKLILSSLLQTYRDLLIVQSAPNQRHLLTSAVSFDQLQAIAQRWSYETIQTGLEQLHTSEGQLRFSPNAQVWLEVCLLNLLPRLTSKPRATSPSSEALTHQNNGGSHTTARKLWQSVIDRAPEKAQRLLSKARMQRFNDNHAVLAVEERFLEQFEANAPKIARMVQKVAGGTNPVTLELRVIATAAL